MDAIDYVKARNRMCKTFEKCHQCPLRDAHYGCMEKKHAAEDVVKTVHEWVDGIPKKTLQQIFLKHFPNANVLRCGVLDMCPERIDTTFQCTFFCDCNDCKKKYWSQEVPDDE